MKVLLDVVDIELLFDDTNCVTLSDWEGTPTTINKTGEKTYYMVRDGEYERCTDLVSAEVLVDMILSDGVVLNPDDYRFLFKRRN